MHIFILKENLHKALTTCLKAVSSRPQLPVLSNIYIKAEKNKFILHSTNLEFGISYEAAAKIEKEGEITVPAKLFQEYISLTDAEKIELIVENNNLIVKTNKGKASFATQSAADFPPLPKIPLTKKKFPLKDLQKAIVRTIFAASIDESRPILTGVLFEVNGSEINLTATDGYRMSMEKIVISENKDDYRVVLPAQTLQEIVRIAQEEKPEKVEFALIEGKNQVIFFIGNILLYTRLIDGDFPQVGKIIPSIFKTKFIVDTDLFMKAVKTASIFARSSANIVKMEISVKGVKLTSNTPQIGDDETVVDGNFDGEEMSIAFNYRFLLDVFGHIDSKEVVFEGSGGLSPGVFKPNDKTNFVHIIMPVRIQNGDN
jgi:DNA polymerase-3 subunit beta